MPENTLDAREATSYPRTPEPQSELAPTEPPQLQKRVKVTRRRAGRTAAIAEPYIAVDLPVPTIEMSGAEDDTSSPVFPTGSGSDALLNRPYEIRRLVTPPPSGPATQINYDYDNPQGKTHEEEQWSFLNASRNGAQQSAPSTYSDYSDSEVSTTASSDFSTSLSGSAASQDSDEVNNGTFYWLKDKHKHDLMLAPFEGSRTSISKRLKLDEDVKFTEEMDKHLMATLEADRDDPQHEPYKMMPGAGPPLGVVHRVARTARKTWPLQRTANRRSINGVLSFMSSSTGRGDSPDTIRAVNNEGSSTPTGSMLWTAAAPQWPRSTKITRRRLRDLCKRQSSLSAHYARMIRSSSPVDSSSSPQSHETRSSSSAFSSRDMSVSLATATAPSMQPENPLAQLASDAPVLDEEPECSNGRSSRPDGWFRRIGRSQAHVKSQSLQLGLGLNASTYEEPSGRSRLLDSMANTQSLGRNQGHQKSNSGPTLDSPFEVKAAATYSGKSHKRRFKQTDEINKGRARLEDVFGPPEAQRRPETPRRPAVRSRGYSMSAVSERSLMTVPSTPPPMPDHEMPDAPEGEPTIPTVRRIKHPVPRLGSPFNGDSSNKHFNTFPRAYPPGQAYVGTFANPRPFDKRIEAIVAQGQADAQDR